MTPLYVKEHCYFSWRNVCFFSLVWHCRSSSLIFLRRNPMQIPLWSGIAGLEILDEPRKSCRASFSYPTDWESITTHIIAEDCRWNPGYSKYSDYIFTNAKEAQTFPLKLQLHKTIDLVVKYLLLDQRYQNPKKANWTETNKPDTSC